MREDLEAYLKARRIVVARAGIAALLKRVLGPRIEQRRKALRSALETLAGGPAGTGLIGTDAAFANVTASGVSMPGRASGSFSGSDISAPSDVTGGTPSGTDSVSLVPSSRSGASLTGATSPPTVTNLGERRRGTVSYAIAGGVLLTLVIVVVLAMQRKTTTTALTIPAASPVEAPIRPPKPASSDDDLPTVSLDKLKVVERERERERERQSSGNNGTPRLPASGQGSSKKPAEAAASAAPPAALPRENPY